MGAEASHLDRHPVAVYLSGLSPGSRRTMRGALRSIAAIASAAATELTLHWWRLDFAHTSAIRVQLAKRHAPATANRMLAALRGVLKAAFRLGLMSADQMTRACSVAPVRGAMQNSPPHRQIHFDPAGTAPRKIAVRIFFGESQYSRHSIEAAFFALVVSAVAGAGPLCKRQRHRHRVRTRRFTARRAQQSGVVGRHRTHCAARHVREPPLDAT